MKQEHSSIIVRVLVYAAAIITVSVVVGIIGYILISGIPHIITEVQKLLQNQPSLFDWEYNSTNVSLVPAAINTLIITFLSVGISSLLGIFTAIYLVEYANNTSRLVQIIRVTTETLSGIPSIIYGLFGSIFFVLFLGLGMSIMSGILTISIMVLPLIIRATEEALKSVPMEYREASFGLGAGKLRTIFQIVLPSATNGILAGMILAVGRIVGETAGLLYTAGTSPNIGTDLLSTGRTLSVHMYMLTSEGLHINQAYATSAVLLFIVLGINIFSTFIAKKVIKGA